MFSGARLFSSTTKSIPNSDTALTFNTVVFDTDSYADLTNHPTRLTAPTSGYYGFGGCLALGSPGGQQCQIAVHLNGDGAKELVSQDGPGPSTYNWIGSCSTVFYLAAGDYIELIAYHVSPGNIVSLVEDPLCPNFWIYGLGT